MKLKNISKFNIKCTEECKKKKKHKKKKAQVPKIEKKDVEESKTKENVETLNSKKREPKVLVKSDKKKRDKEPLLATWHIIVGVVIVAMTLRIIMTIIS